MDALGYGDFSARLHGRAHAGRVPINGTVELTRRCTCRCVHCCSNLPLHDRAAAQAELTGDEHLRIIDEVAAAGCLWLLMTGGEILVRADFLEIYTHARRRGLLVTLFTNGTLLDERIADHLVLWRPFSIEITLYGRTAETFERVTRSPGSYARCMRAVRLLADRGLPLALKTVALRVNRSEVRDMQRFAEEELGVKFRMDGMIHPRLDGTRGPIDVRLSADQIVALDVEDPARAAEWRRLGARVRACTPSKTLYGCGAGCTAFHIDPFGRLALCGFQGRDTYDLRRGTFKDGWERHLRDVRGRPRTRTTRCACCGLRGMCAMCPEQGYLEHGDAEGPVDFLCRVAHLRAYALGIDIPLHGACPYCPGGARYEETRDRAKRLAARGAAVGSGA